VLRERAAVLGISLNTLRRRLVTGQARAEHIERAPGIFWQVYLGGAARSQAPANETAQPDHASAAQQPPTAIMKTKGMAAYGHSLRVPLQRARGQCEERARRLVRGAGRLLAEDDAVTVRIAGLELEQPPWGTDPADVSEWPPSMSDSLAGPHEPRPRGKKQKSWWQRWRWWMIGFAL
jgi:hypothetical protein